jgi:hypothetical protein
MTKYTREEMLAAHNAYVEAEEAMYAKREEFDAIIDKMNKAVNELRWDYEDMINSGELR